MEIADGREGEVGQKRFLCRDLLVSGRKEQQTRVLEASECGNLSGQEITWKGGRKERYAQGKISRGWIK